MKTYHLQVVGHGEYQDGGDFRVAENWIYKFYVKDGEILSNEKASKIYDCLNAGKKTA